MKGRGFFIAFCTILSIGCLPSGCERPPAPSPLPPLRVATNYWPGTFWIDIARDQGWFAEAGLETEFFVTDADFLASMKDVVEDRLDTVSFTLFDLMLYNAGGADLVAVLASDYSNGADAIIGGPGVEHVADLRGKRVGFSKGSYQEYILATVLRREGIAFSELIPVETKAEDTPESLANGLCDAVVTWEPYATETMERTQGQRVFDTSAIAGLSPGVQAFRRQTLNERPGDVQKFVDVWHRATTFIEDDPGAAYAIVARLNGRTPAEVEAFASIDQILSVRDNKQAFSFVAGFDSLHGSARIMNRFLRERNLTGADLDSVGFLDYQFIHASMKGAP